MLKHHPNPETEFWLGHLSKENNSHGIASLTVNYILKYGKGQKKRFKALPRKAIGPIWEPAEERQLEFILKGVNITDEGYVVAKEVSLPGVDGIEIGGKVWTCECGDFLWKSQKKSVPCKHILRILHYIEEKREYAANPFRLYW